MTYNKEKQALDQKVQAGKRGVEDEERRLESQGAAEDLDRLTADHYATIDVLRVEIEVRTNGWPLHRAQGSCICTASIFATR